MAWGLLQMGSAVGLGIQAGLFLTFVFVSALFSAAEASLISLPVFPRRKLEQLGGNGNRALSRMLERPNRVLVTVLLGNYLFNVSAAVVAVSLTLSVLGEVTLISLLVAVLAATLVLLTLGEFVPRALATVNPDRTARAVAPWLGIIQWLLFPAVWLLEHFSSGVLRVFGAPIQRRVFLDEDEFKQMVEMGQAQGIIEKEEQEMIAAVIDFADLTAGDIMVPRTDMVLVEDTASVREVVDTIRETGYSRIPVYHDDVDTIIGVVYGKDLLGEVEKRFDEPVKAFIKQAIFVPETAHLDELLREMKARRIHIGIVHDEFGGTAGLISLEDVLEEIVGDIFDEYDPEMEPIEWLDDQTAIVDARLTIGEVNDELGITLPLAPGYETLAGFLFHRLGRPGRTGEVIEHDGVEFELERVANRRILTVKATMVEVDPQEADDGFPMGSE